MNQDSNYGRLLANRYQLSDLVGEGAMGKVYRAKDTILGGVTVAVKFLSHALLNQNMRDRFEREATISALLGEKSIHVVRVRDYGVDDINIPFYVMEFLSGESINEFISYQPMALDRFFNLIRHVCLGLESAHQGIYLNGELCRVIHRDIKPSNIIVIQDPSLGEVAKILDFGIAKLVQADASQTQSFMGTLAYCSPEQMEGQELDNRSDIYSLGVMMYEMLTMNMPLLPQNSSFGGWYQAHHNFEPEPFSSQFNLPKSLQDLVFQCLAKEREARPQSVREILEVLETFEVTPLKAQSFSINLPRRDRILTQTGVGDPKGSESYKQTINFETSITEICLQVPWPEDKPLGKIVFCRTIDTALGEVPALCVMLDLEDINHLISSSCYNHFLYIGNPHPMLLWVTLLYNRDYEAKWLPCYLDLKSQKGQQIVRSLAQQRKYRILLYNLEQPQYCQHIVSSAIDNDNCQKLDQWANISQVTVSLGDVKMAKRILKQELEKSKEPILNKVKASNLTDVSTGE